MIGGNGWIGNWTPGIGDPTLVGWLTVGFYMWATWLGYRVIRLEYHLQDALEPEEKRLWWTILIGLALLGINKQLDLQSAVTEIGRMIAVNRGWYEIRRDIQALFIGLVSLLALAMSLWLAFLARRRPTATRVALVGYLLLLAFVVIRAASFHYFDVLIRHLVAGMRMNWIEIVGLLVIAFGARLRART